MHILYFSTILEEFSRYHHGNKFGRDHHGNKFRYHHGNKFGRYHHGNKFRYHHGNKFLPIIQTHGGSKNSLVS